MEKTATRSKGKIIAAVTVVLAGLAAVLVYALQFSALSYQLDCSREANRCVLVREMVIGGAKEDVVSIDQIKKIEISFHKHDQNVWIITETERFPLGTYSSQTSEANRLMNDFESYLHDSQQDTFSHSWPKP